MLSESASAACKPVTAASASVSSSCLMFVIIMIEKKSPIRFILDSSTLPFLSKMTCATSATAEKKERHCQRACSSGAAREAGSGGWRLRRVAPRPVRFVPKMLITACVLAKQARVVCTLQAEATPPRVLSQSRAGTAEGERAGRDGAAGLRCAHHRPASTDRRANMLRGAAERSPSIAVSRLSAVGPLNRVEA